MSNFYVKDSKIYSNTYMEIYVPEKYFKDGFAIDKGNSVESNGIVYIKIFKDGNSNPPVQLFNLPTIVEFMVYDFEDTEIVVHGHDIRVMALKYLKDMYIMPQMTEKSRDVAGKFLNSTLMGKLPDIIHYSRLIDIWWKNIEIAGTKFHVPSKILEIILATIYRDPNNFKERYGIYYGKKDDTTNGYDYMTGNPRDIVEELSTFSGLVFEDISRMITSGITNTIREVDEPVSPLEKTIYY